MRARKAPLPGSIVQIGSLNRPSAAKSRVRILPNHACATAAQHDDYQVLREGRVAQTWERIHGW